MWKHTTCSAFCSRASRSWGFNLLFRNHQHAHKLYAFWLQMGCAFVIFAKSTASQGKRTGGKGGRRWRQSNHLKSGGSVPLRRRTQGQRDTGQVLGLGDLSWLPHCHEAKINSFPPCPACSNGEKESFFQMWEEQVATFSRPAALPLDSRKQRQWLLFSFFVLLQHCPSWHCWVTQPGGLLWLSCSFSIELFYQRKPITVQPTMPGDAAAKPQGQ